MIRKTTEATGDLIGNRIAYKITRVSKKSPHNNSETKEEEILRERFIPLELLNHEEIIKIIILNLKLR